MIRFEMYEIDPSDIPVSSGKGGAGKTAYVDDVIDHFRRSDMKAAELRGGYFGKPFESMKDKRNFVSAIQAHLKSRGISSMFATCRKGQVFMKKKEQ